MSEVQEINVGGSVFDVKDKSAMTLALNNKVGAKNRIVYPYHESTTTLSGVTFTVNSDGTVGVDGTATALTGIALMLNKTIKAGKYILSSGIANENVWVRIYKNESPYTVYAKTGLSEVEFEFNEDMDKMVIAIGIDDGYTASNIVVKPMLRFAEDPDDTYELYAMTNRELTEKVIDEYASIDVTATMTHGQLCQAIAAATDFSKVNALTTKLVAPNGYVYNLTYSNGLNDIRFSLVMYDFIRGMICRATSPAAVSVSISGTSISQTVITNNTVGSAEVGTWKLYY